MPGELFDDRNYAGQFFRLGYGGCSGAGGFAADIEEIRPFRGERQRVRHGGFGGRVLATIGKGIGRDIDDAHDERAARKPHARSPARQIILIPAAVGRLFDQFNLVTFRRIDKSKAATAVFHVWAIGIFHAD